MKLNLDEYFYPTPGSEREKEVMLFARRHWVSFLGQIILSGFMIILPIVVWILLIAFDSQIYHGIARNFIVVAASVYYLITVTFTFAAWITYYYDIYIVTKDTVIDVHQLGFFGRKIAQLSLLRVQDVSSHIKGFLPTLFAYGDVLIETAGEQSETFLFEAVPNPQEFSAKVLSLHNELIAKELREKETMEAEGVVRGVAKEQEPEKPEPPKKSTYKELLKKDIEEQKAVPPTNTAVKPEVPKPSSPQAQQKPTYQELLNKDIQKQHSPEPQKAAPQSQQKEEGEIPKDDLQKGGEVKF